MKTVLIENEKNIFIKSEGFTKFKGCCCYKDCNCMEKFKSEYYIFYIIKRKLKKTTTHNTLKEAMQRWSYVNTL